MPFFFFLNKNAVPPTISLIPFPLSGLEYIFLDVDAYCSADSGESLRPAGAKQGKTRTYTTFALSFPFL